MNTVPCHYCGAAVEFPTPPHRGEIAVCAACVPAYYSNATGRSTQEATAAANARGEGFKADQEKPDWSLLPWDPLEDIVRVLTFGARKYAPDNWQRVPDAQRRYFSALMRHLVARLRGERLDPETGYPHLAHAGCCLLFAAWFDRRAAPSEEGER